MSDSTGNAREVVDELAAAAEEEGSGVTFGDVARHIGHRGHSPFMLLPMLVGLSPLGGIVGVPTTMAIVASLGALAILFGRESLWLPDMLERREVSEKRVDQALRWLRPAADWLDRHFGNRLKSLTNPVWVRAAAVVTLLLAITVPPSEIIPWAATPQMLAIGLFGLAFLMRDGAAMLTAFVISAAAFGVFLWLIVF